MAHYSLKLPHFADEHAVLEAHDSDIQDWLEGAKAGHPEQRKQLYVWAYLMARRYYRRKVDVEAAVTIHDAEEMAAQFFLDFERNWYRIQSATHYTRRMLKRNLKRYMQHKRHSLSREYVASNIALEEITRSLALAEAPRLWENWTDEEWHQYQAVLKAFHACDETTQAIIAFRLKDPPPTYREMAIDMDMPEATIRMRVTRFYRAVRKRYKKTAKPRYKN